MKSLSTKQQRKERKKKKLAALVNIIRLNDKEQTLNKITMSDSEESGNEINMGNPDQNESDKRVYSNHNKANDEDHGFTLVERKKRRSEQYINAVANEESEESSVIETKRKRSGPDAVTYSKDQQIDSNDDGATMTSQEYTRNMAEVRARRRNNTELPYIEVTAQGLLACISTNEQKRVPIFLTDIQHMLMMPLFERSSPCPPSRWIHIEHPQRLSNSVIVVLEGVSLFHFLEHKQKFDSICKLFDEQMEVTFPPYKENAILEELIQAPLIYAHAFELIKKHGCLEIAITMNNDPVVALKSLFKIGSEKQESDSGKTDPKLPNSNKRKINDINEEICNKRISRNLVFENGENLEQNDQNETSDSTNFHVNKEDNAMIDLAPGDKIPRTKLLLSALQMVDEGYPVPLRGENRTRFNDYICTKEVYEPVTDKSPLFAVDCEMCKTSIGYNELTRISIVNEECQTVYETLVMPTNQIVDYLTRYSGITPHLMKSVTKRLRDVQREVRELLPADAILVGQSLNSDLNAMRMFHPYVIDTSVCYNMTGDRLRKSKLQALALRYLQQEIQKHDGGHDSVEDSLASIRLVKMKLANSLEFGDEILLKKKSFQSILSAAMAEQRFTNVRERKRSAVIHCGPVSGRIKKMIQKSNEVAADDQPAPVTLYEEPTKKAAVRKAREAIKKNALTIVYLKFEPEQFENAVIESTIEKINKHVTKIWKATPCHALFSVLLTGSKDCTYGTLQVNVKPANAELF